MTARPRLAVPAVAALVCATVLVAGCSDAAPQVEPSRGPNPAAAGVERLTDGRPAPPLDWRPCPDAPVPGFECAELAVPRDYRDPASPTWTLAVSRLRATDPFRRRGVLLSSPGGPGAPGRWNTLGVDQLADGRLRPYYDLIGLDVRGTGASRPAARCGLSGDLLGEATADPTAVDFDADLAVARDIATSCARTGPEVLPHLGTVNVVRDMEMLRAALGEPRLSFSGVSYGTSLGSAYASLYPDRTDRVLLDSLNDDTVGWRERFRLSNAAVDARFADVAATVAADRRWALGTGEDVRARYLDLRARAIRGELDLAGTPVTAKGLRSVLEDALRFGGEYTDDLADVLAFYGSVPHAPDERALATRLGAGNEAPDGIGGPESIDQQVAVGFAVRCIDSAWSRDPENYRRTFDADRVAHPISSGARATIEPCAFWPWSPREPLPTLTDAGHSGTPQALLLQHRTDPATPLTGAQRVRATLGSRAVMITTGDGGHGVLGRDDCPDEAAVAWLIDGELPEHDTSC